MDKDGGQGWKVTTCKSGDGTQQMNRDMLQKEVRAEDSNRNAVDVLFLF